MEGRRAKGRARAGEPEGYQGRTPSPQGHRRGAEMFPGGPAPLTPSKRREQHGFAGWGPTSAPVVDYRSRGSFRHRGVGIGRDQPRYPPESTKSGAFRDAFGIVRGSDRLERSYGRDRHERERGKNISSLTHQD